MTASNSNRRDGALDRLAAALGTGPGRLEPFAALDAEELDRLHDIVSRALAHDEEQVDQAVEETVRFVPRPLRGRARKMLFPEDGR